MQDNKDVELINLTQIGMHSVRNILGSEQQLSLFSEHKPKEFASRYGMQLEREIARFGIDLTDMQQKVMEAILFGFSETRYEGNIEPQDKYEHAKNKFSSGELPSTYKYIKKIPRLRVTQSEILKWAGINRNSAGAIQQVLEAIAHLATTQYCIYYTRLALDENGQAIKDKEGDWKKEEVMAVDTLFTIGVVRDKKMGTLQYYEITPSPLFLDQRESYFLLIPYNWRQEVRKLIGERKASSYTFRFLLFLRYQFELRRRASQEKKPYIIKWSSEEIAKAIKMPDSVFRRKKARANQILEEVYSIAKKLGYLSKYERNGAVDMLFLNEEKYYMPRNKEEFLPILSDKEEIPNEMLIAKELYDLMIKEKKKIDPRYNPPGGGPIQKSSLMHLAELLNSRSFEEIKEVLMWGLIRPYWCNRIGTPSNLRKNFSEAISELRASKMGKCLAREEHTKNNKLLAEKVVEKLASMRNLKAKVEAFGKYVEIGDGVHQPICINYSENGFKEQLENALRKWGILDR
jgi:hypothetical protein